MTGQLLALVVSEGLAQGLGDLVEFGAEGGQGRSSGGIGHLAQQHQARAALDKDTHRRAVALALDDVTLPVPRHQAVIDLGWAYMDADHLGQFAPAIPPSLRVRRVLLPWRSKAMSWLRSSPQG